MTDKRNELDLKLHELGFNAISRTVIHSAVDELGLLDREDETKLELRDGPGAHMTLVMQEPDGKTKHIILTDGNWVDGEPRPTEPGVYQDPKNPTHIYTLYNNGMWKSNRALASHVLAPVEIPDNLTKIA